MKCCFYALFTVYTIEYMRILIHSDKISHPTHYKKAMDDLFKPLESLSLNNVELTGKELGRGAYGVVLEVKVSGLSCAGKKLHDAIAEVSITSHKN